MSGLLGLGVVGVVGLGFAAYLRLERSRNLRVVVEDLRNRAAVRWASGVDVDGVGDRSAADLRVELSDRGNSVVLSLASRELPRGIALRRESFLSRVVAADVVTGDRKFDEVIHVVGPESKVLALLDARTREAILGALGSGEIRLDSRGVLEWRGEELREAVGRLRGLVDVALELRDSHLETVEALARNAAHDRVPGVRRRNLEVLQMRFPGHRLCREASRRCLGSGEPELRLLAADYLAAGPAEEPAAGGDSASEDAEQAADVLVELATSARASRRVRLEALRALSRPRWRERAITVLREMSRDPSMGIRREAISGLGRLGDPGVVSDLLDLLDEAAGPTTAAALAEALGETGAAEAEEELLALLREDAGAVRRAAIEALGRVGTVAAVEPLLEIADSIRPSRESRAARRAVEKIQSRLDGVQEGQLALVEPDGLDGALSPAPGVAEEGAVSLAGDGGEDGETGAR